MHRQLGHAILAGVVLCASSARGEELRTSFEAGVRAGFAFPVGDLAQDSGLANTISWSAPIQVDAGARIGPAFVGGYFSYAFGKLGSNIDCGSASCSVSDVRVGFEVLWHFAPGAKIDPWAGLGLGYEWLTLSASAGSSSASGTVRGFEFANVQAGVDFVAGRVFRIGPFVMATLAQYSTGSFSVTGSGGGTSSGEGDITNKTLHSWLSMGLRFALVL
jgi:hypothetical protein